MPAFFIDVAQRNRLESGKSCLLVQSFYGRERKKFRAEEQTMQCFPCGRNQAGISLIVSPAIAGIRAISALAWLLRSYFANTRKTESHMQEKQNASGVEEAKAVLSDLAGLGAESVRSARQWLHHRRKDMQQRNQSDHGGARQANGQGSHRGLGPRSYQRPDAHIEDALNERLTMDDEIDARDVNVTVSSGVVTLDGEVGDRWQRYRADDIANSCYGVRQVENRLRVSEWASSADSQTPQPGDTNTYSV